jgi:hypothetical protein
VPYCHSRERAVHSEECAENQRLHAAHKEKPTLPGARRLHSSPETLLAGDSQLLLASTDFFWFGAILAPMTVLTGSFSGIAATNQCFSSRPHKNFCLARSSSCTSNWRLSKARCFSRGCKFRTSISCLLPGAVRISKNSPALSRRMSMTICGGYSVDPVLFQHMRRGGGAASITFTRAPIREKNRSKLLPTAFSFLL